MEPHQAGFIILEEKKVEVFCLWTFFVKLRPEAADLVRWLDILRAAEDTGCKDP